MTNTEFLHIGSNFINLAQVKEMHLYTEKIHNEWELKVTYIDGEVARYIISEGEKNELERS